MGINKKRTEPLKETKTESHLNWMAGTSYDVKNPLVRLQMAASSCFFGEPMYYHDEKDSKKTRVDGLHRPGSLGTLAHLRETLDALDPVEWRGMSPQQMMESAIDAALDHDADATLRLAAHLREVDHMRTTPQVILVRAAHHKNVRGTGLIKKWAPFIVKRGDEPAVGMAYHFAVYKDKAIPNALKKAWAFYLSNLSEFQLAKYRMENRQVKTVDVVNLVHAKSPAIGKLVKGNLKLEENTWESLISKNGSSKKTWMEAIDLMGHMALLRNLRNLTQNGVEPSYFVDKLVATAKNGQQLPFRYVTAFEELKRNGASPAVLDAIEQCLEISLAEMPKFKGKTMCLSDNSGSAHGAHTSQFGSTTVAKIDNLTSVIAAMCSDEGHVGVFGNMLKRIPIRKKSSLLDQVENVHKVGQTVGEATENGVWIFFKEAIQNKEHWDNIFVFSDMQAGHGGLYGVNPSEYHDYVCHGRHIDVAKLVKTYRQKVNPNVNVFLVQTAGYQDTLIPEFYRKTYILGGWSENLLKFAAKMIESF